MISSLPVNHAVLSPSGASAWSRCALWPTMNARFPQDDSAESLEGTAAHWVAWENWNGRKVSEGTVTPYGVVTTDEMIEGAELLCEAILARIPHDAVRIESRVNASRIHPQCWGTPDVYGFSRENTLHIVDYKFGHGFVDEYFNLQALIYAVGVFESVPPENMQTIPDIEITIVQPRCFYKGAPVRSHRFKWSECEEHIATLRKAADAALLPNPIAATGEQCGNCPGRHACSTLQRAAYQDAEFAGLQFPHDASPQAADLELRMLERRLERLTARVEGLRESAQNYLMRGQRLPYHRLEQGKTRRQWSAPLEEIVALGEIMDVSLVKPGVITPLQAEKKGIDATVISQYSQIPTGSMKLVTDNPADARRVFGVPEVTQ